MTNSEAIFIEELLTVLPEFRNNLLKCAMSTGTAHEI